MFSGFEVLRRKYFILWDIVNPQLESGLGLGLGLGSGLVLGLDSVRGSTISHNMKYLPTSVAENEHDRSIRKIVKFKVTTVQVVDLQITVNSRYSGHPGDRHLVSA